MFTHVATHFRPTSEAEYKALCKFCDDAIAQPFTSELSILVDAALVRIMAYEERVAA